MSESEDKVRICLPGVTRRKFVQALGSTAALVPAGASLATTAPDSTSHGAFGATCAAGRMGPRRIRQIETVWIPMSDGVQIAARILLPDDAETRPVPAILEYIPYRRRDGTRIGDDEHYFYFASHGYACVRPDIRGSGDSEGILKDEYLKQEQDDGLEIIAWIARQSWCTGKVGMTGISWGGFSALQVAARRPPALHAIITACSTDDRYTDDAHYLGGTIVQDMFVWGSDFYTLQAFPPDPAIVGERWRDMWRQRCEAIDFSVANWVRHQTRDAFWKHASVDENYQDIVCPVYAVGGWADGYTNSIPRLMQHLTTPRKALIGPWSHTWPNAGGPGPLIDYLDEARRWWDHWLKGIDTGIMDEPMYRVWMQEDAAHRETIDVPGRWITEQTWPSAHIRPQIWHLNDGSLDPESREATPLVLAPDHQTVGITAGHWCPGGSGVPGESRVELPLEQQFDDGRSLLFDSAPLSERIEILGFPAVELDLAVDQPVALVAVRLDEVHPGGTSRRMTYGVLNLTHRDSHEHPTPLEPGKRYRVRVELKNSGFALKAGSRIRVALSTSYWPLVWPSPRPVTLTLWSGSSTLILPVRTARPAAPTPRPFGTAFVAPNSGLTVLKANVTPTKSFSWDVGTATLTTRSRDGGGVRRFDAIGTIVSGEWQEISSIRDDDPTSAHLSSRQSHEFRRGDWQVRIETTIEVSITAENYILKGTVNTFHHDKPFFTRSWNETIPRELS